MTSLGARCLAILALIVSACTGDVGTGETSQALGGDEFPLAPSGGS